MLLLLGEPTVHQMSTRPAVWPAICSTDVTGFNPESMFFVDSVRDYVGQRRERGLHRGLSLRGELNQELGGARTGCPQVRTSGR